MLFVCFFKDTLIKKNQEKEDKENNRGIVGIKKKKATLESDDESLSETINSDNDNTAKTISSTNSSDSDEEATIKRNKEHSQNKK